MTTILKQNGWLIIIIIWGAKTSFVLLNCLLSVPNNHQYTYLHIYMLHGSDKAIAATAKRQYFCFCSDIGAQYHNTSVQLVKSNYNMFNAKHSRYLIIARFIVISQQISLKHTTIEERSL